MISPSLSQYDVILQSKYFLREAVEKITLEERLDEIAYRGTVRLAVPGDQFAGLPIIKPGHEMRISGIPFGGKDMIYLLHPGVVWDVTIDNQQRRHWDVTIYDRAIYLAKSEDEYFFAEGTTATQRIQQIAADWKIPIYSLVDTKTPLAKAIHRAKNLWSIIQESLQETAEKSGKLYRLRMASGYLDDESKRKTEPGGFELVELGTNNPVWVLEYQANLESSTQHQTLDGAVTQVKVLGNTSKSERSPLLGTVKGQLELGTLQKIHTAPKATSVSTALKVAENMLSGIQETVSVSALDINTVRAGDKIHVHGWPELLVVSVKHECGTPGRMALQLASREYIRRRYYGRRSVW